MEVKSEEIIGNVPQSIGNVPQSNGFKFAVERAENVLSTLIKKGGTLTAYIWTSHVISELIKFFVGFAVLTYAIHAVCNLIAMHIGH